MLPRFVRYVLPESALILIVGLLAGLGMRESDHLNSFIVFNTEVFFAVLLPPIIFYAGYSLEREHGYVFFSNIGSIIVFAVFGTLISTVVVAMLCYAVAEGGIVSLSLVECWLFGALISAIDPVATISIFEAFHVENTLFNLVFGESVLNDAVAIVLYRTVNKVRVLNCTVFNSYKDTCALRNLIKNYVLFGVCWRLQNSSLRETRNLMLNPSS